MKKLLILLFFIPFICIAQIDTKPGGSSYQLQSPKSVSFWWNPVDSSLWSVHEGKWQKVASATRKYDIWNHQNITNSGWSTGKFLGFNSNGDLVPLPSSSINTTVQSLTTTTPTWDCSLGVNATITLSAATTITLNSIVAGSSGNLTVTNPSNQYNITLAGYTNKISPAVFSSTNVMLTSGSSKIDIYSWYYDGTKLIWNGQLDYK